MEGPLITLGGVGSGIDIDLLVQSLVSANEVPMLNMQSQLSNVDAAVSTLSEVGGLLSTLKTALEDLDTAVEVGSYKASSSDAAIVASANGTALPGSFDVTVNALAKEQRTYTDTFASSTTALGQSGTLDIQVGTGTAVQISVDSSDTLESLVGKINGSGANVNASIFYDGSNYRMQVRGTATGASNSISFTETGTTLGLTTPANTVQAAQDASVTIDGFTVTRDTNQITGAIQGVTLALTATTTSAVNVKVEADPEGLQEKLQTFVDAYNAVNSKIHFTSGFGSITASNPELAGDSALRTISNRLSDALLTTVGSGALQTLASLGVNLNNDGSLKLDATKLSEVLASDPSAVTNVLAGDDSATDGVMDVLRSLVDDMNDPADGILATREDGFESRAKTLEDRIEAEQARLGRLEEMLRRQFINMDSTVAGNLAQLDYVTAALGGGG